MCSVSVTYRCTAKENATGPLNCTHPVIATDVKDGSDISYSIMTGLHVNI